MAGGGELFEDMRHFFGDDLSGDLTLKKNTHPKNPNKQNACKAEAKLQF